MVIEGDHALSAHYYIDAHLKVRKLRSRCVSEKYMDFKKCALYGDEGQYISLI